MKKNKILMTEHIDICESLIRELEPYVKTLSYIMKDNKIESFLFMIISAKNIDLYHILNEEKRQTDKLFSFDKNRDDTFYVLVCMDTKVEGSYKFSERLMRHISLNNGKDIKCMNIEIKGISHHADELILDAYNDYLYLKHKSKAKNVQFKTIH